MIQGYARCILTHPVIAAPDHPPLLRKEGFVFYSIFAPSLRRSREGLGGESTVQFVISLKSAFGNLSSDIILPFHHNNTPFHPDSRSVLPASLVW
jgi:hypothetical protein